MELNLDKSNWKPVTLGDVVEESRRSVKDPTSEGIERVVGLEHIEPECIHLRSWTSIEQGTTFTKAFREGQVLFGRRRAYLKKAAVATFKGICSGDITVLEAKKSLLPELLPFLINNDKFFDYAVKHSAGGLSPRTKFKDIANYEFLLPPKAQQAKLAELLWAADEVVDRNSYLLRQAKLVSETQIEHNLTSPEMGSVLSDYCTTDGIKVGPFGSLVHKRDYVKDGIPIVMPADIVDGRIQEDSVARISEEKAGELKNYRLQENDILFPRRGDLTKRALIEKHQRNWICGSGTFRVRLKPSANPSVVYLALTSATTNRRLLEYSVGTTMPNLNAASIKKIPIHLPEGPDAEETLTHVELTMNCISKAKNNLEHSKQLLKSLINEIF